MKLLEVAILAFLALSLLSLQTFSISAQSQVSLVYAPTRITVGDGEEIRFVINVSASGITKTNPTIAFVLTIEGVDPSIVNYSTIACHAVISGPGSLISINDTGLYLNESTSTIQAYLYYTQALPFTDFNMSIVLIAKPRYGVYNVSTNLHYLLTISTADNPYALQYESTATLKVVPKPPAVELLSVEPYPAIFAPGTTVNTSLLVYDASYLRLVNITVLDPNGSEILVASYVPSTLVTTLRPNISIDTRSWHQGLYKLIVYAEDRVGIGSKTIVTYLNATWVFYVPTQFPNVSSALEHRGTLPGSKIVIVGNVSESRTIMLNKPNIAIVGSAPSIAVDVKSSPAIEISAPNVTVANISVLSSGTVVLVNRSLHAVLENVNGYGDRFIEVIANVSNVDEWNHTVDDCKLNGRPVLYAIGGGTVSRVDAIEAHMLFGNYSVYSTAIDSLYAVNASLELYNTSIASVDLLNSKLKQFWSLSIYVTFAGKPVANASVVLSNNLTATPLSLRTDTNGRVTVFVLSMVANDTSRICANATRIEASKHMFRTSSTVMVDKPMSVRLALPTPSVRIETTNIRGLRAQTFSRGEVAYISVSISGINATSPIPISIELDLYSATDRERTVVARILGMTSASSTIGIRLEEPLWVYIKIRILDMPSIDLKPIYLRCS